ncbi:uncharacterized protein LOC114721875 isoform X2 [Neltuma alba]|uniref:uncharacterized protein LOC114721875 isoform X2 n=1 Tax=Neltuma alba TaxID=207710 RepID=UPI0010A4A139|nr:uncharacterized protein LOC114721875 isoform X2 [Prosopis alba]
MAENTHREIEIRTLSAESIVLRFPSSSTVQELKLLLNQTFPPAAHSPNFHLFFKGDKLRLHSQIDCYPIETGDFLVLVPFTKKSNQCDAFAAPPNVADTASISNLADSTWSNIMEDISYLRETRSDAENDDDASHLKFDMFTDEHRKTTAETPSPNCPESKSKWDFGSDKQIELPYHLILSKLQYTSETEDALGEHNCEILAKVLASITCLSDLPLGHCKLFKRARQKGADLGSYVNNGSSCLCPQWLKKVMKAFTFINIFSSWLHWQGKKTASNLLEKAMNQLGKFGVKLDIQDMKHLSLLCPELICFSDDIKNASYDDVMIIINHSARDETKKKDTSERGRKWLHVSKIVSALKRRDGSFRNNLWMAFSRLLSACGDEMALKISLEDLVASIKDQGSTQNQRIAKPMKRSLNNSKSDSDRVKCHETSSLLPMEMVEHLQKGIGSEGQIVHIEDISARKAIYAELELSENMKSVLHHMGISKLYSHQAESIEASFSGKNVVVSTMTSSGKSLCYNLPVLEWLSRNQSSCALYIFPTKALAQDQLRALAYMTKVLDADFNIGIYDGDTSQNERTWLLDTSRLLITNPDMLHISILPHHQRFCRILSNLRFVVIDETHTYKGAFGCHTAFILRRLKRLCTHVYGTVPSFVFSTATSANPREHSMELANLPTLELVQNDGSPSARKLFILWNPILRPKPFLKRAKFATAAGESVNFVRSSSIVDVSRLFAEMVQHGLRCITFCKSRKLCELVLSYTQEILHETAPHLVDLICAYRGGYLAEERRKIESEFFGGKLCGVVATNALELGIDVGEIDVTLHLGFPGSVSSLWQQAGRGGRRDKPSLAVYVAFGSPLDQYFMRHPEKLFGRPIECCHVDAQNKQVLEQHLVCAAHEHPLNMLYDEQYFGSCLGSALISLKARGYLSYEQSSDSSTRIWTYIGPEKLPSHAVNIRAIETIRYEVIDQQRKQVLEEIEESKAFFQVYEGAVYLCQGKTYLVEKLDLSNKVASCKEADLKYYTKTRDFTDIHVIGGNIAYPTKVSTDMLPNTNARADLCKVTTTWFGFYRIWRGSNQIFDTVDLSLPQYSYESQAVWIPVSQSIKEAVVKQTYDFRGGLHAASHAVLNVVPLNKIQWGRQNCGQRYHIYYMQLV